jgi:hypothetical protein
VVWSDRLLDEWQRVIVREGHRSPEAAALIADHIRAGFADSRIPEDAYKHLLAELNGPDHDDLHHTAAAIAGNAETLITWNLPDFPTEALGPTGSPSPRPTPTSAPCSNRSRTKSSPPSSAWPPANDAHP